MPTASWVGAVVERGVVSVDNGRDEVGVAIIDLRGGVSVEVSCAGGRQLLAGGGRVIERELVQDQHAQREGNGAYQQQQPVDS